MHYLIPKNFIETIEYSPEDKIYFGRILDIPDLVNYEANSKTELKAAFIEAIIDYVFLQLMLQTNRSEIVSHKDVFLILKKVKMEKQ